MEIYRQEYPNPQWERKNWRSLNGEWEFDFDFGKSAREDERFLKGALPQKINVPFCPESELSGIGHKDFIASVCYRRVVTLSDEECANNVFLHFGAVDYECFVYVNGKLSCRHIGGYTSFTADITPFVHSGENEIFVIAEDDTRSGKQPLGKQSEKLNSFGCFYTRTTGIWQSVYLEFVPKTYIKDAKYYPNIESSILTVTGNTVGKGELKAVAFFEGKKVGETAIFVNQGFFTLQIELDELHLWELGDGKLYDLELTFNDDTVKSYFGMREVSLDGKKFVLNGKTVFQRTVLDQGFYPDGIYTAKSDEVLESDVIMSMKAGFNGARLHQKVFEPRFLYHCDRHGYMVWGEHGNWGMDYTDAVAVENFTVEWLEAVERDFNHPSIIGWCPYNETWGYVEGQLPHRAVELSYKLTKSLDPTRLCVDTSGNYHIDTIDIYDVHNYEQNVEEFSKAYEKIGEGILYDVNIGIEKQVNLRSVSQKYNGEAVFVSEYGGIKWDVECKNNAGWGYGNAPTTEDEFIARYKGLTDALLDNENVMGFCYTQLYDVEQEVNGLYTYNRVPKFDMDIFKKINQRKAKIEE